MPYCPKCRYEYREGFDRCESCDAELLDELHEAPLQHKTQPSVTADRRLLAFLLFSIPWILLLALVALSFIFSLMWIWYKPGNKDSSFEVLAIPRYTSIPVYQRPDGRQISYLSKPVIADGEFERGWVHLRSFWRKDKQEYYLKDEYWVRQTDISVDPKDVKNAILDKHLDLGEPGGEPGWEIKIIDANNDGIQDVLWQYPFDGLFGPNDYAVYLYAVKNNQPLLLIRHFGEYEPFQTFRRKNRSYAFGSAGMFWKGKAYVYDRNRFKLQRVGVLWARAHLLTGVIRNKLFWISLLAGIPPALLFLFSTYVRRIIERARWLKMELYLLLSIFCSLLFLPTWCIQGQMLLPLFLPLWIAGLWLLRNNCLISSRPSW